MSVHVLPRHSVGVLVILHHHTHVRHCTARSHIFDGGETFGAYRAEVAEGVDVPEEATLHYDADDDH